MPSPLTPLLLTGALAQTPATDTACKDLLEVVKREIPAVQAGEVSVSACAFDPGYRAKIMVSGGPDPVGAVVGPEGVYIQAVVEAMKGLPIDILPHSDDPAKQVAYALSPAVITRIYLDEEGKVMDLVLADDQIEKAAGPDGRQLAMAAELTGYTLNLFNPIQAATLEASME